MLNQPSWFSENYYYAEKMKHVESLELTMTLDELKDAIAEVGGAWAHYQTYGYKESYKSSEGTLVYLPLQNSTGNVVFDPQVYCESKLKQLLSIGYTDISATSTWQDVAKIITVDAGMSLYDHYVQYGQAEGLSVNSAFSTEAFFKAKLAYIQANAATMPAELTALATWQDVAAYYADKDIDSYQNWVEYGTAEGITADAVKPGNDRPVEGDVQYLNPYGWFGNVGDGSFGFYTHDDLTGTDQDDLFVAYIYGDANSLNTGDKIDGKGGVDTLEADLAGISYTSALTPQIKNVEIMKFRVQEMGGQTGDNNVGARIDAERISAGTAANTEFWSWNSRDDLLIEDVRIDSTNVVVGMQETDPGRVDYRLYFDSKNLKTEDEGGVEGNLRLILYDGESALKENKYLKNNYYDLLSFHFNNQYVQLKMDIKDISGDAGYPDLAKAIQGALDTQSSESGFKYSDLGITVSVSEEPVEKFDGNTGKPVHPFVIILNGSGKFDLSSVSGEPNRWWTSDESSSDLKFSITGDVELGSVEGCPLIQTNIALDDVGRVQWADASLACLPDNSIYGSNAGDMVVGSMATRGGIERFNVTVDRGSWLSSLSSTNNALRMITVSGADWNGDTYGKDKTPLAGFKDVYDYNKDGLTYDLQKDEGQVLNGQLFIGDHATMDVETGVVNTDQTGNTFNWQDAARLLWAGSDTSRTGDWGNAGIWDVKLFDATNYTGDINIAAVFTAEARDKYLADVDGLRTVYKDSNYAPSGDFEYNFGTGHDTLNMLVNGGIAADRDFILNMNMGAGEDYVNFAFDFDAGNQVIDQAGLWADGWAVLDKDKNIIVNKASGLKNVSIDTGADSDTVWAWTTGGLMNAGDYATSPNNIRDQRGFGYDGVFGYVKVDAGTGDDAVYTAQDGAVDNAVWVLNANSLRDSNEDPLMIRYDAVGQAQPINNDISSTDIYVDVRSAGTLYGAVQFLGVAAEFSVDSKHIRSTGTGFQVLASEINKAIIDVVTNDPQLGKLIAVFDGAGNSLLVQSLIDGRYTLDNGDFSVRFSQGSSSFQGASSFDIDGYVQQARNQDGTDVGNANRVFEIDFSTIGGRFAPRDVGVVYTVTIDGVAVSYTQKLSDENWSDIVDGLNAAIAANATLGGIYEIQPELNADGSAAINPLTNDIFNDVVTVVRTQQDYVGNLNAATTTTTLTLDGAVGTIVADTNYVFNFGGVNVTANIDSATIPAAPAPPAPVPADADDLALALQTALNNSSLPGATSYAVSATAGPAPGDPVTLTIVSSQPPIAVSGPTTLGLGTSSASFSIALASVATGYTAEDPDISYSVADFVGNATVGRAVTTGTLTFALNTDWTANAGTVYTVHLQDTTLAGAPITVVATYRALTGDGWANIVDGLNANAGNNYTITSSSTGVLSVTSRINDDNRGNKTHDVTHDYDVTCSAASFSNTFGNMGGATTVTGLTFTAGSDYKVNFGNQSVNFTLSVGDVATFATELQAAINDAIRNAEAAKPDPDKDSLTVLRAGASGVNTYVVGVDASGNITINNNSIVGAVRNVDITVEGAGTPKATPSTTPFDFTHGMRSLEVNGWTFDNTAYDTFEITLTEGANSVTLQYKQRVGDTQWAHIANGLNNALKEIAANATHPQNAAAVILDRDYSIRVGSADGTLRIVDDRNVPSGSGTTLTYDINYAILDRNGVSHDLDDTRIVNITSDNFSNVHTTGVRQFAIRGWDFSSTNADTFALTIDPDGDGSMAAFTLTYTQTRDALDDRDTWNDVYAHLLSQVRNSAAGRAFAEQYDLVNGGPGVLQLVSKSTTSVGTISDSGNAPTISINYSNASSTPGDAFVNYEETHIASTPAVGLDQHDYGLTEVHGGAGDDVLVTGFADAFVRAGAGNDVIVVGNETYNFVFTEGDSNIIHLGVWSDIARTTSDVTYARLGSDWGNNGNNVGTDESNPAAHDKVFVTGSKENVIYNFDVDTTANVRLGDVQSDRLYGVSGGSPIMGTYDAVTGFAASLDGHDMQLGGGSVILVGVGNVPGVIGLGGGKDEFGDYVTVTVS